MFDSRARIFICVILAFSLMLTAGTIGLKIQMSYALPPVPTVCGDSMTCECLREGRGLDDLINERRSHWDSWTQAQKDDWLSRYNSALREWYGYCGHYYQWTPPRVLSLPGVTGVSPGGGVVEPGPKTPKNGDTNVPPTGGGIVSPGPK